MFEMRCKEMRRDSSVIEGGHEPGEDVNGGLGILRLEHVLNALWNDPL